MPSRQTPQGKKMNLIEGKRARFLATVGGVLYLVIIGIGALGEAVERHTQI